MSSEPTPAGTPANPPPNPPPPDLPAGPPPATPPPPVPPATGLTADDKNMALLAHILAIPLGFLGPLIIWLVKRDTSAFVADQGKEALNFQITVLVGALVSVAITVATCGVGFPLVIAVAVCNIVFCIIGALKAKDGVAYRYPICIRLVT